MNQMMSMMMNVMMMGAMGGLVRPVMAQAGRAAQPQEDGVFHEVARIRLSDATDLTISEVNKYGQLTGYSLTKYVRTQRYTGYGRGVFIPIDKVREFLTKFGDLAPWS